MIEGTIARNGEILRSLYFIRKEILVRGMDEQVGNQAGNDGMHDKGIFLSDNLLREINQAVTLIERGLPCWAKEIVEKTFESRGVIIWEPIKKEVGKDEKTV